MNLKVGDRVKVVDSRATYSTYASWVETFAPAYLSHWHRFAEPNEIYQENEKKNSFLIVAKANHIEVPENTLYLIQAHNGCVYLMDEEAITPIDHHLQIGNIVHVTNTQFVYESYEHWLIKNEPSFRLRKFWKPFNLPVIGERYRIVNKAPKGEIFPFNETNLCLISGPLEATDINRNVFIVEENALFLDMF